MCWALATTVHTRALHHDYHFQGDNNKGKWVLHTEQNVLMFQSIDNTSKCTLYSMHSPCLQCSSIIREKQVKMVYFLNAYRPPPDLKRPPVPSLQ